MNSQNNLLPIEIINEILSYGDPIITRKFSYVLAQLKYNKTEFEYLRQQPNGRYSNWSNERLYKFMLIRTRQKMKLNNMVFHHSPVIRRDDDSLEFLLTQRPNSLILFTRN